jgi:hypothetical protein
MLFLNTSSIIRMSIEHQAPPVNQPDQVEEKQKHASVDLFRRVADFCNSLPLAGKIPISMTARRCVGERNPYYKSVRAIETSGLMAVMILGHSFQVGLLGVPRFIDNIERFSQTHSPESLFASVVDLAFITANCAATYAQLHLSGRLIKHFRNQKDGIVPILSAWGINGEEVDYDIVSETLLTAIIEGDQSAVDSFFMILPKDKKQTAMERVRQITSFADAYYSYEAVDTMIDKLKKDIDQKSRARYVIDIIDNAHKRRHRTKYSNREVIKIFIATIAGQAGFMFFG